jgi:hypothetical protein
MANIVIDIAAEFTGGNAFKKAETSTDKLSRSANKLGKAFIGLYSTQKILAYGKASLQAAADDEKAQKQLALALKNVGLGRDVATSEEYIQKLQKEFGILDDELRPAYQTLAVATQDTAESQRLLQLALDISASTGKDLGSVTAALSKAYLGNNTALSKLGVGISKASLKTKSFKEITDDLAVTFKGAATQSANTFQGSMDKLAVASNNAKEIIGQGLMDALQGLGEDTSVDDLATSMEGVALAVADAIRGVGVLIEYLQKIPGLNKLIELGIKMWVTTPLGALSKLGQNDRLNQAAKGVNSPEGLAHLAELESKYTYQTLKNSKKLTAEESKQLKAKQLKLAIDKANLALGKGSNVFDMEKIQLAVAEKNQAEQLGKITNQTQLLQITNDLARLEVKQSILDLEDAIASKDVAAITNATNKLNADLKVLGALNGQKVKLTEIEDILKAMLPKDLINIANLDEAIAKLKQIGVTSATPTGTPTATPTATVTKTITELLAAGSFVPVVPGTGGVMGGSSTAGNYASSGFPGAQKNGGNISIVVNGAIDANSTADAILKVLTDAANNTGNSYNLGTGSKNTTYVV